MRRLFVLLCGGALAASSTGCSLKHQNQEKEESPEQQATRQRESASQNVGRSAQQFEKTKADYLTKAEDDLNGLEARIAAFKAKSPTDPDARASHETRVDTLEANLTAARTKLDALRNATSDDWQDKQQDVEQAILVTRAAADSATQMAH